jgi:hypothetical protein
VIFKKFLNLNIIMHSKTGPDLLRQTITRLWQYNIYVQKPFDSGYSFINIFKVCYLIEVFLVFFRPSKLHTRNKKLLQFIKKTIHRLIEPSSYKLINFRLNKKNQKLFLFCNIGSRAYMYPTENLTFSYKILLEKLKKKIKSFKLSFFLLKCRFYTLYTFKLLTKIKKKFQKNFNKKFLVSKCFKKFKGLQQYFFLNKKHMQLIKSKSPTIKSLRLFRLNKNDYFEQTR